MNWLYKLSLKEKIFLLALATCLVLWLSFAVAAKIAFQTEFSYRLLLLIAAPLCIVLVMARKLSGYITRPVISLTALADEVSQGDLGVQLDFGKKVKCWEIKDCNQKQCPAYGKDELLCWFVDGTPCRDCVPRFPDKLVQCRHCFVYKDHRGDEIVQLADSFRHMLSELKASHHELEISHRLQDGVISHTFDGIIGADMDGNVLIFNTAASNLAQYSKDEVIGKMNVQDFFPIEFDFGMRQWVKNDAEQSGGVLVEETQFKARHDSLVPVKVTVCFLRSECEPYGIVCFVKDLREIERLKKELLESERLALVGEITSVISHSIRNIIDGLRGGSYVLKSGQTAERWELVRKGWEIVDANLHRIDQLMYQLLNVSEGQTFNVFPYDMNRLLEETLALIHGRAEKTSIRLVTKWSESPLIVKMDPDAMMHCFYNLLLNAIDACGALEEGKGEIQIHTEEVDEDWICVTFVDNGVGMSEHTKRKMFKETFMTKGSTRLGLGLFIVDRLIKRHGGEVSIESHRGRGTKVAVKLSKKGSMNHDNQAGIELSG